MIAFDTNILVYAQQKDGPNSRHERATALISAASLSDTIIPVQVLGEFLNVCMRKFKMASVDAIEQVEDYIRVFICPQTTVENLIEAANLSKNQQLQYFDALILTVARRAGASLLLSEDMHDGLEVEGLRVLNPFNPANEAALADWFGSV